MTLNTQLDLSDILKACGAITGVADNTPLVPSPFFSQRVGGDFYLKLENMQPIGAFKIRGALTAISALPDNAKGVICCSTGNHGRGVAYAAKMRGLPAVVCMSSLVPQVKVEGIRALGADVRIIGDSQDDAWALSEQLARDEGLVEISPFDDPQVIAGQGTIGLEILERIPDMETLIVPVSGGGLIGGIALAAKTIKPSIKIIGVSMDRGAAMYASLAAGSPVDVEEVASLADSLGGGIGADNRYTLDLCKRYVDELLLVTEEEIYHAMQALFYEDRIVAEGACVVGLAAILSGKLSNLKTPAAAIITGRNLNMKMFADIIEGRDVVLGNKVIKGQAYA